MFTASINLFVNALCYGPNFYVPQNSCVEALTPRVAEFEMQQLRK